GGLAADPQEDLLVLAGGTLHQRVGDRGDAGVDPPGTPTRLVEHDHGTAGMVDRQLLHDPCRPLRLLRVGGDDDHVEDAVAGMDVVVVAELPPGGLGSQPAELAEDLGDRDAAAPPGLLRADPGHGRCQWKSARAISSSAAAGPQVPAS